MIRFGSVCSGIEAASVAWHPLGWQAAWLAEIEPFPCAVLAHHYPDVPNLGDMTTIAERVRSGEVEAPDVFTGGTPCQAFSVAGKRGSLSDARGNLSLSFVEIANAVDDVRATAGREPCVVVWENVPGVLSTTDNAFGCFIGALAGADDALVAPAGDDGKPRWSDAGVVLGPRRAVCWRTIDAQFFGLAQRRRRVFVVASARNGFDPATVLLEFDGVRRDSAPRREAREGTAGDAAAGARVGGGEWPAEVASTLNAQFGDKQGLEDQHALNGAPLFVPSVMGTLTARMMNALGSRDVEDGALLPMAFDAYNQQDTGDLSKTVAARSDQDTASLVACMDIADTLTVGANQCTGFVGDVVAHTLRGDGFDASEDGTGRGTPLVPVAFSCKDHGADAGTIAPTLRSMGHDGSHANGGGQVAVAFGWQNSSSQGDSVSEHVTPTLDKSKTPAVAVALRGREGGATAEVGDDCAFSLRASSGGGDKPHVLAPVAVAVAVGVDEYNASESGDVAATMAGAGAGNRRPAVRQAMSVRRLTPRECERLQGFPDDYTAIPWRGKAREACPDGPRYKALGNSWAVPCARWLGRRIDAALRGAR
jgi:DNA (cytosine-5)-methyltransferase 1